MCNEIEKRRVDPEMVVWVEMCKLIPNGEPKLIPRFIDQKLWATRQYFSEANHSFEFITPAGETFIIPVGSILKVK